MTLATRALFTGAVPDVPPRQTIVTLTTAPHGGWTTPQYPKAMYADGATYAAYVNGTTGGLYVLRYAHATKLTTTALLDTPTPADTHNNPAVLVRDDGRILVLFCEHDGDNLFTILSTNAGDISAWGAAANTGLSATSGFTYPGLVQLTGVTGSPIWLVIRDKSASTTGRLRVAKSTDGGATWGSSAIVMAPGSGLIPYWGLAHDTTKLQVMMTDRDAYGSQGTPKVGHMYFDGETETWHQSDGTEITATKPFAHTELTQVYEGPAFVMDGLIVEGLPRFAINRDIGSSQVTGSLYRWSGSAWASSDVYTADHHPVDRYYGSLVMNRADPEEVFAGIKVGSFSELYRYRSSDDGATWGAGVAVTDNPDELDTSPIGVIDGVAALPVLWLRGSLVSSLDFHFGIMGLRR